MHDDAWRTEAGFDHDNFLYARLLPHTAEDTGRIPHAHETLDSFIHLLSCCDSTRYSPIQLAFIYIAPPDFGNLLRRGDGSLRGH